jgi:hypothetical protein
MPQQSLSDFVSAMEAAGMLVRVTGEKRVDELPPVMEDHPKHYPELNYVPDGPPNNPQAHLHWRFFDCMVDP